MSVLDALAVRDLLSWVGRRSQAERGLNLQLLSTIGPLDWASLVFTSAATQRTIVEAHYPKPTPVVAAWSAWIENVGFLPRLPVPAYGYPLLLGLNDVSPERDARALAVIEWLVGGARFKTYADISGGALSIPAAEWVRVSYIAAIEQAIIPPGASLRVQASIIPSTMHAQATLTSMGVNLNPVTPVSVLFGPAEFARGARVLPTVGAMGDPPMYLLASSGIGNECLWEYQSSPNGLQLANNQPWMPVSPNVMFWEVGFYGGFPGVGQDVHVQLKISVDL